MPSRRRAFLSAGALLACGVALAVLAHPPVGLWPCALLALAPLAAFAEGRRPAAVAAFAWLQTTASAALVCRWLVHATSVGYGVGRAESWVFLVLFVGTCALDPAAAAALYTVLRRRAAPAAAPLLFASVWTAGEWLRAGPFGVPWLLAAHPLAFLPAAIQTADLGGALAPGALVALAGAGLGIAAVRRAAWPLAVPLAAWAAAGLYAALRLAEPPAPGPVLRIGVVQAAVPQEQRFQPGSALRNTLHHLDLTRRLLARERLDLVVWSETAVDADLDALPELVARIAQLVDESGVPLVTGAPRRSGGPLRNSVVLFRPGAGLAEAYDKQRLVPFAEADATALGWLSPLVGRVVAGEPYAAGRESRLLHGPATLATPVCFEITYADLMRRFAAEGAELFVNLSNDAWFGRTGYPAMHLAHAPFRAVEHRRSVVRGTNTGISAVIDPTGQVRSRLGVFEEGALVAEVRPARAPTFYTRHGDVPILSALGVVALGAIAAGRRRPG